jgi:hypothetical protein
VPSSVGNEVRLILQRPMSGCRSRVVPFNGTVLTTKYDDVYHIYRPPRSHHCRVNNVVIDRFDHFCPWMGNTIGGRNYRPFLLFLVFASLQILVTAAFCVLHITEHVADLKQEQRENKDDSSEPMSMRSAIVDIIATPVLVVVLASA